MFTSDCYSNMAVILYNVYIVAKSILVVAIQMWLILCTIFNIVAKSIPVIAILLWL